MTRLAIVGDALLDRDVEGEVERLCPEAPVPVVDELVQHSRPGGAGLAAALAAADGYDVVLVTALARDAAGRELAALLADAGVDVVDLGLDGPTPEKMRVRAQGRLLLRLDRGGRTPAHVGERRAGAVRDALEAADGVLVADYGRSVASGERTRALLAEAAARRPVLWDPHPRGGDPVPGARLATPNRVEAARLVPDAEGHGLRAEAARARELAERWAAGAVAITLGEEGALLVEPGSPPLVVRCTPVVAGDPCGAGDRFAATAASRLAEGAAVAEAVEAAVAAASAFVAGGGAGALAAGAQLVTERGSDGAEHAIARVRARGGTVVATGGCFDLVHAGHVAMLEAARSLGDCLIVLVNSDDSVRRLKGPDRPLVPQEDRVAVLNALACVDAVVVFDEDTPAAALDRLRPDVFAKGGDYTAADLPESAVLEGYGGQVAILPYVAGRSTTRLIEEAATRGGR